jgi:hypothetical protein
MMKTSNCTWPDTGTCEMLGARYVIDCTSNYHKHDLVTIYHVRVCRRALNLALRGRRLPETTPPAFFMCSFARRWFLSHRVSGFQSAFPSITNMKIRWRSPLCGPMKALRWRWIGSTLVDIMPWSLAIAMYTFFVMFMMLGSFRKTQYTVHCLEGVFSTMSHRIRLNLRRISGLDS